MLYTEPCFLLICYLVRLAQNCMTLLWWFSHKTAAFYTEQCISPSFLLTSLKSHEALLSQSLKNYGFICDAIFFTCTHVRNHLQGRRQDFCFGVANLAAKGSLAGSTVPGIAKGVRGHAPPENFEILGCLKHILRQVETVKDNKKSYANLPKI